MELLKKFDAQNYKDTTSVFEKYTIRGIIVRDGKIAMQCSKEGEYKIPGGGMEAGETYVEALSKGSEGRNRTIYHSGKGSGTWRDFRSPKRYF